MVQFMEAFATKGDREDQIPETEMDTSTDMQPLL